MVLIINITIFDIHRSTDITIDVIETITRDPLLRYFPIFAFHFKFPFSLGFNDSLPPTILNHHHIVFRS